MIISLIGSNGLLSDSVGRFCERNKYLLHVYGRTEPNFHECAKFTKIDLLTEELNYIELCESDVIIYAAGAGIQFHLKENIDIIYDLNVSIPIKISNNLKENGYKGSYLTFGSYFEIGETEAFVSFSESDLLMSQLNLPNDYCITKRMLSLYSNYCKVNFTHLHFILPTIYGESESHYRLIPYILKAIQNNSDIQLTSGTQVRQYIYVNDVVELIFDAVYRKLKSGLYNIEGVEEYTVKELVKTLFNLKDKIMPDNIFGKAERVDIGMKVLRLNGEKLKSQILYSPKTKISDVIDKYIL